MSDRRSPTIAFTSPFVLPQGSVTSAFVSNLKTHEKPFQGLLSFGIIINLTFNQNKGLEDILVVHESQFIRSSTPQVQVEVNLYVSAQFSATPHGCTNLKSGSSNLLEEENGPPVIFKITRKIRLAMKNDGRKNREKRGRAHMRPEVRPHIHLLPGQRLIRRRPRRRRRRRRRRWPASWRCPP